MYGVPYAINILKHPAIGRMCATVPQRGPVAKLLWADLLPGS